MADRLISVKRQMSIKIEAQSRGHNIEMRQRQAIMKQK